MSLAYAWIILQVSRDLSINNEANDFDQLSLPKASIIVVVRNEEEYIEQCIQSILKNDHRYLDKVIVVDDHSTDNTLQILNENISPLLQVLELKNFKRLKSYKKKYKKAGLHYGLNHAQSEWIMTTDGDCWVGHHWIMHGLAIIKQKGLDMCTGWVNIKGDNKLIELFQNIEMKGVMAATLMGIKSGQYYSANAANMVFKRQDYLNFLQEDQHHFASGDDLFFINWCKNNSKKIGFVNHIDALVSTPAVTTFRGLVDQRIRWATKTTSYDTLGLQVLLSFIFLFHLVLLLAPVISILFFSSYVLFAFLPLITKLLVDHQLITKVNKEINEGPLTTSYPILGLLHAMYIVAIGLLGLFIKNYNWKGRRVH